MEKEREEAIKKYWNIAKEKNPFTDETISNGYLEGFIDLATEITKEQQGHHKNVCEELTDTHRNLRDKIADLEAQIEKMKKYGKLLQDICVAMGNDPYMIWRGIEQRVLILWDKSEEAEGLKLAHNILDRLLEIKPQDWVEIEKWEIKENG